MERNDGRILKKRKDIRLEEGKKRESEEGSGL